jgi:hypothetical protein
MKKSLSIISVSLEAAPLLIPSARGFADDERSERQDMRQDQQQLAQLRREREHEIGEGDRRETRDYDQKIHELQKDIRRDQRCLGREDHDRRHHEREHEHENEHEND